jgi:AcrR family transcriptional regulator
LALLDAAADLIAKRGFEGSTVEAIAKQARVNKAMISYHFGGKRGLYGAITAKFGWDLRSALTMRQLQR